MCNCGNAVWCLILMCPQNGIQNILCSKWNKLFGLNTTRDLMWTLTMDKGKIESDGPSLYHGWRTNRRNFHMTGGWKWDCTKGQGQNCATAGRILDIEIQENAIFVIFGHALIYTVAVQYSTWSTRQKKSSFSPSWVIDWQRPSCVMI